MLISAIFLYLSLSLIRLPSNSCERPSWNQITLILNALDDDGLIASIALIENMKKSSFSYSISSVYFFRDSMYMLSKEEKLMIKSNVTSSIRFRSYGYTEQQNDTRIGKMIREREYVSLISSSWRKIVEDANIALDTVVLSLAMKSGSLMIFTPTFQNLIDEITKHKDIDIMLPGKNRKMSSISDWHDLSIVSFVKSDRFIAWLDSFQAIYKYYSSNRDAYSMLEPRPAILEATALNYDNVRLAYWDHQDVCSTANHLPWQYFKNAKLSNSSLYHSNSYNHKRNPHVTDSSKCRVLSILASAVNQTRLTLTSAIEVYCVVSDADMVSYDRLNHPCLTIDSPSHWKRSIGSHIPKQLGGLIHISFNELKSNVVQLMWHGLLRFRNTLTSNHPRQFCWEISSNGNDRLSESDIEYNITHRIPFQHPQYEKFSHPEFKSRVKAVIFVGLEGSATNIDKKKYLQMSKMAYAKRHGYKFAFQISNEFTQYFPKDLWMALEAPAVKSDYFRGIMTKPLMILDAMYRYPDEEWLVWTDEDIYINPGWLYLPLDVFLEDVPNEKVFVMGNYRSAFTNVFMIRNNHHGRLLVIDWIAITMSGYIQCHGYDQAALAALILQRISRNSHFPMRPLNYTCLYSSNGTTGCNDRNDWSCDFKFERALYRAGFKTRQAHEFFGLKISSFTKGCANDMIPDFHIITETPLRPRFQCGLCTRLSEIESAGHWDGPLGGGNQPLMSGSINGYFFNHKSEFLFYETYLNDHGCRFVPQVVPLCNIIDRIGHDNVDSILHQTKNRHIVSLTDGYAFDYDTSTICRVKNETILARQRELTYMRDYEEFISVVAKINDDDWKKMYQGYEGGEGRCPCTSKDSDCKYGENEDGQKKRRPKPWIEKKPPKINRINANQVYFDEAYYCQNCRTILNTQGSYNSIDCRRLEDEQSESRYGINID